MMKAIVYTSNAGSTAEYAQLLSREILLPYYDLDAAKKKLKPGDEIIYFGWILASEIKGYKEAQKRYKVSAVCAVGMGETGSQIDEVRKKNHVPESVPVFTLQGQFDLTKLKGLYKIMMSMMVKTAGKALSEKVDRTPEEDVMLEMMQHGGNH
ncbi:MAG: flavodoxin domain-containing protein, partial [Lachnospiraceae bacterium]|nr:flavodoxin domain-containing protein [Lachnospiraceae bacterium]